MGKDDRERESMQQENNDELRAKAMALEAQIPNSDSDKFPPPPPPPPKVREEGELTSSDDDALPAHADAPSTSISAPPSSTLPNVSLKTYLQSRNPGKPISASLPARAADKHRQASGYSKGFNRNKVLLKSSNPGWHAPAGNANLVISFSDDDDSGSDKETRQKTAQATIRHPQMANSSQRPPALPHMKPDTAQRTAKNEGKVVTKKVALNRTFMSSMTKIHGSNVKVTSNLAERKSWSKNSNVTGRILPSQDGRFSKSMDLSSNKLQDLRQQIAMRENELMLKKVQKSKENVSEPCRDIDVMGQSKVSSKKSRIASTDGQTDTEETDAKRLKLAQNSCGQPSSRGHLDKSFVLVPSNDSISAHIDDVKKIGQKGQLPSSTEMQIQDRKQLPIPLHNERIRLAKDASGVGVSCSLSDWVSRPVEALAIPKQPASLTNATFADHLDKSHTDLLNKSKSSSSVLNHEIRVNNMNKVNDHYAAVFAREKLLSKSDSSLQPRSLLVSDNKFESPTASPDNTSVLHSLDRPTVSGCDVDSLFETEELHDKELEEAQEHRRRCEIDERKALKAYRKAQRALTEANARCTYLYRKRELYSAQLRSFLMEDCSVLLTPRQHRQIGDTWNLSYNVCKANMDLIPTSSHQLQAECEPDNQVGYVSNAQSADGDAHNRLYGNEDGNNLGSEACSEPDASTSDLLVHGNSSIANGVLLPSNDPNLSPDDGETFPLDHGPVQDALTWPREEDNSKGSEKDMNVDSARCFTVGSSQDPLFLEAYLRSKLFSRLGVIDSSKKTGTHSDSKSTAAKVTEENFASRKTQIVEDNVVLSDSKDAPTGEGSVEPDSRISKPILNIENQKPVEEHSLNNSRALALDYEDTIFHSKEITSASIISSSCIFRSAMMAACRSKLNDVQIIEQQEFSPGMHIDNELLPRKSEDESSLEKASWPEEVIKSVSFDRIDSYTFKGVIDPFRPLCMYELRGRCNNDECPWQHLRDKSSRNVNEHDSCDDGDCQPGSSSNCPKQRGCIESGVLTPPKYVVCFDSLKAESQIHGSPLARHIGASPKNIFSSSLAVSNSLVKQLPSDEPYLHGNDGCVDSFVGGGHSLYFQSRNGAGPGNPLRNGLGDNDQALEIALLVLIQEVNRIDGMKKALSVLSRALEADCASFQLWIVYLLLYHSTMNSVSELSKNTSSAEDDLFSHAVKHNTQSYELWLLYINSRRRLNDRFAAYERALSCLCHHASAKNGHAVRESAAILDLFLQMLQCFCISGNIAKAVQRIQGLILPDRDSDESHSLLLSDILQCLTMSDKCIFWVSCVYLVIYRKLPDALVQQFEYQKDISLIEWPSVRLPLEEKQQVFKLIELAVDSLRLNVDCESSESRNHMSAHLIALNHIHLVAAIDGEERCKMLLEKYKNSYPAFLQLSLLSARAHGNNDENKKFDGFEEALGNWPTEVPGIQCIWNQFAEYAIENGRTDRAKEIMDQWFHSVWKPLSHDRSVDSENDDNRTSSPDPVSESNLNALLSDFTNMDLVFGLLNLSLLRLFQNDVLAAHTAVDKALKTADTEVLSQCVREHAAFLFHHRSQLEKDSSLRGLMDILKRYVVHTQSISAPVCLTTKFIDDLKKPRLRQLFSNILCPSSPDSCLVNSVLATWFGPSLLPQNTNELKDLVDFIEFILEVSPGNYQVAISACRLIWKNLDGSKSKSPGVFFWASSLLVNTIYRAIPVPPEFVWVEAADLLGKLTNRLEICKSFQQRALSVYPFSVRLWKSFLKISAPGKRSNVIQAARGKGIELDYDTASHSS